MIENTISTDTPTDKHKKTQDITHNKRKHKNNKCLQSEKMSNSTNESKQNYNDKHFLIKKT